jgi:hypothetical protein
MKLKFITALMGLFFSVGSLIAQTHEVKQWLGFWKGTVTAGSMQIGLTFHVTEREGQLFSTLDVPLQGLKEYKVESTVVDGESLTWTMGFGATFKGNLTSCAWSTTLLQAKNTKSNRNFNCTAFYFYWS